MTLAAGFGYVGIGVLMGIALACLGAGAVLALTLIFPGAAREPAPGSTRWAPDVGLSIMDPVRKQMQRYQVVGTHRAPVPPRRLAVSRG